jgi:hypothetical protein
LCFQIKFGPLPNQSSASGPAKVRATPDSAKDLVHRNRLGARQESPKF